MIRGTPDGAAGEQPLRRCVGDVEDFADRFWGRRVLVHGPVPEGFEDLLSLDDVDRLLAEHGPRTPAFRLVRDGSALPSSEYTRSARIGTTPMSGLVDPVRVFAAVEQGATLVLQGMQRYWPPLLRFCRDLELELGHQCQINAYVTPPSSQGFSPHTDAHDVFVLQAFGAKTWRIWTEDDDAEPEGVELEPGTAVYMPSGIRHAARTQHTLSGHLTIGIHPTRWRQVMERALAQVLDDSDMDTPLPVGFPRAPGELAARVGERLEEVGTRLAKLDAHHVADDLAERFLTDRPALLRGGLIDRMRLSALDDTGRLRRRPGSVCELRAAADGRVRVLLGDRELRLPDWLESAMREIVARPTLAVADLAPYLDRDSRLVLLRRLVREGLLEVVDE